VLPTTDPLSASDALLWRIEADPVLRSPIVVVGLLDRVPAWHRVTRSVERAAAAIPRLRCRIVDRGGARWELDPSFHLEHHLRRARTADAAGIRGVLDVAEADAADAFEPTRPPWTFTLVEDGAGGAGFVLRFHHAISDGVGAVGLADHLFDTNRRGSGVAPAPLPAAGTSPSPSSPLHAAAATATEVIASAIDPIGTAKRALRFRRSLQKLLGTAAEPLSPVWRDRGVERRLHVLDLPIADLLRGAAAAAGTVNDVHLGAVAGAAHRYHEAVGAPVAALRFTVPISLRTADDGEGGNHFSPARFVLPVDDPDPVHRARLAGAVVRGWRSEPALRASGVLAALLDRLPTPALVKLFAGMLRGVDIDAVDVPGLQRPAYFAGAKVDRLWAFAPPAGAAVSVTLVSHGPSACIGLACDVAAVADPDLLADCLRSAYGEAVATGRPAALEEVTA
jgi:diacylglycerol O-acyltransferase